MTNRTQRINTRKKTSIFSKIIILIILLGSITGAGYFYYVNKIETTETKNTTTDINNNVNQNTKNPASAEDVQNQISTLKKRLSFKGLIQNGDLHFQNKEYTRALTNFLQVHKKTPNDQSIINKIGNIYFKLHKYPQAYKYYSQIKEYKNLDIHKSIKTYLYSQTITSENLAEIHAEIKTYSLSPSELFYYTTSVSCNIDFEVCNQTFATYFQDQNQTPSSGSGELISQSSGAFQDLENIKDAYQRYEDFQLDDISYKHALIIGEFFKSQLYPIAIATAQQTLINSPDYRPVIKIIANSYFDMGKYIDAKKYLVQYNGLGDNDPDTSYFLGIVHQKLREYTRSIIQLRKALLLGYKNELDIRRRLVYNYSKLGETDKMLKVFQEIIEKNLEEVTTDDLNLSIFYHILSEKYSQANEITTIAMNKFPDEGLFYGYNGWLLLEEGDHSISNLSEIDAALQKSIDISGETPMITLTLGKLEELKLNPEQAHIYYKQTISLDKGGEYEKIAKQRIADLSILPNQE
ncbi:MAG: hypothetical protein GY828_03350 [Candidatus Gracilibacteria bacterium]|nr:hypothetical protein [Candidatus Gracilibacteria bacterium]